MYFFKVLMDRGKELEAQLSDHEILLKSSPIPNDNLSRDSFVDSKVDIISYWSGTLRVSQRSGNRAA